MAEAAATISVQCKCGKKLKAPATAVGKKAKCPKCGNVLTVTPPPPPPEDDSLDALYDLAAAGEEAAQQQQLAPRCPNCMRELANGAVLCTNCGYDTRSGKSVAKSVAGAAAPVTTPGTKYDPARAAAAEAAAKKSKGVGPVDKMAPQGPFWKGVLASAGGAVVGAIVWVLIARVTGYWGMLPLFLIALLAGIGMQWGQEGYSYLGGFTAAGIMLVVMIGARLLVILALVLPSMKTLNQVRQARAEAAKMPDLSMYDYRIVRQLHEEQERLTPEEPAKPEPAPSSEDEDEDEDALDLSDMVDHNARDVKIYQEVEKKLKAMPKDKYAAWVKKLDEEEKAERLQDLKTEDILLHVTRIHPDRASSVEFTQAVNAAKEKIAGMTPAQRDAEYQRLNAANEAKQKKEREEAQRELAEMAAKRGKTGEQADRAAANAAVAVGVFAILYLMFGGIRGWIIIVLALGLAYRTASGSVSDS